MDIPAALAAAAVSTVRRDKREASGLISISWPPSSAAISGLGDRW
jgi:hypothetical protein